MDFLLNFIRTVAALPGESLKAIISLLKTMARYTANLIHHLLDMIERRMARSSTVPDSVNYQEDDNRDLQELGKQAAVLTDDQLDEIQEQLNDSFQKLRQMREKNAIPSYSKPLLTSVSKSSELENESETIFTVKNTFKLI